MGVTKRYTIAYKGLKPGLHDFRFEVDGSLFEEFESPEIKDGACEVTVALERGEAMLTLDVTVDGSVVVECDRCLEECRIPVHYQGRLLVKFSDEVHEYDGEVMWLLPMEGCIPKGSAIRRCSNASASYPTRNSRPSRRGPERRSTTAANGPSWPRSRSGWRPKSRRKRTERRKNSAGGNKENR